VGSHYYVDVRYTSVIGYVGYDSIVGRTKGFIRVSSNSLEVALKGITW